ncbi:MAG: acyl-CoA dehydrogenase family protein [Dehalococcoidia bacterium]
MTDVHPILAAARDLAPLIRAQADAGEALRRLPDPVVAALRESGAFRMAVPRCYSGPEVDPLTVVDVLEELAAADGAAGWCAGISTTTSTLSVYLDPQWAEQIFSDPALAFGGAFAPTAKATTIDGGWEVTGRWMWGSGTHHCAWINGGAMTDTGEMRLMFYPASDVTLLDNWHAVGLKGTGSGDYTVERAFVPAGREIFVGKVHSRVDTPLGRFPNFNFLAIGVASVTLGIARRAIEEITALASKRPANAARPLAEHIPAQLAVGEAEARLSAARAFLRQEVGVAWQMVWDGARVPTAQRARIRLACAHAAMEATRAVDLAYNTGGGTSVFESNQLQRCFRDVHTATQHAMISDRNIITYGRVHFGLEADNPML